MRVSVEFVIFKQKSSHLNFIEEDANGLIRRISDIDGCSLELYLPGRRRTMVYSPTHILWKESSENLWDFPTLWALSTVVIYHVITFNS